MSATRAHRVAEGSAEVATFDVDDVWMFRFARTDAAAALMRRERSVHAVVSERIRLPIPRYELGGRLGTLRWGAYRKLAGVSGEDLQPPPERWPRIASQLASFLTDLHALPRDAVEPTSMGRVSRDLAAVTRFGRIIEDRAPEVVTEEVRRYLRGDVAQPAPGDRAFCHADLKGEHLLLAPDGGRVVGVLDWTDAGENDPAVDFGGLAIWLGPAFVREVLARYRPRRDEAFFDRVVTLARLRILAGIGATLAGEETWPIDLAKRQLERAFGEV
jgi:aminoglycoside phosphotransferase (APT) family kinase protein